MIVAAILKLLWITAIPIALAAVSRKEKMNNRIDRIKDDHKNNSTDNIKVKMNQCRALCVL